MKYLGVFSQITRKHSEILTFDKGLTVNILKDELCKKYGRKFKSKINDSSTRIPVFVKNGISLEQETELNDNEIIIISYPVGGG